LNAIANMARPKSEYPTELELEILKILWCQSPLAVRDVRRSLAAAGRKMAHTSVITTLNVMVRKRYLRRSMQGNACYFEPRASREAVSQGMLGDIVDRVFNGSARAVVLGLFDCKELDADELKEMRRLIDQKTREKL
jgi:BlaI family transcriptional regulator, penicillinase repressor